MSIHSCFNSPDISLQYVHRKFPENVECLKFLVKISSDLGLKEAGEYAMELKKAERARELKESRISSSRSGSRIGSSRTNNSRNGSAVRTTIIRYSYWLHFKWNFAPPVNRGGPFCNKAKMGFRCAKFCR